MRNFLFVLRLSIALVSLGVGVLFGCVALGLVPDLERHVLPTRAGQSQALGLLAAEVVRSDRPDLFVDSIFAVRRANPDLLSAGLRDEQGRLQVDVGQHAGRWRDPGPISTLTHQHVDIRRNDAAWGRAEFLFTDPAPTTLGIGPIGRLAGAFAGLSLPLFGLYLWRVVGRAVADADVAVPQRVRQALDTLTEGVLILDSEGRIAYANRAFQQIAHQSPVNLIGHSAKELPWHRVDSEPLPWDSEAPSDEELHRRIAELECEGEAHRLVVNSAPVIGQDGRKRGTLVTVDDLTPVERLNAQLQAAQQDILRKNEELQFLATRDPMTHCLNRRAFFETYTPQYHRAAVDGSPVGCIMVDVDKFKSINDNHGHAVGDDVLREVASRIRAATRGTDFVCRYGGEEFTVGIVDTDTEGARQLAERIRRAIEAQPIAGLTVTASLGVANRTPDENEPGETLKRADAALYEAKRTGRNRVVVAPG